VLSYKRKFDGSTKRDRAWSGDIVATSDGWNVIYFRRPDYRAGDPEVDVEHAFTYSSATLPLSIFISFDVYARLVEYQCDAALPATIESGEHSYVDLDLDLIVRPGRVAFERDFDDFAARRSAMCYTTEAVGKAYEGLALAHALLDARACPFDGSPELLLDRILAAGCAV
jgi:protein associated with RNAse G/E